VDANKLLAANPSGSYQFFREEVLADALAQQTRRTQRVWPHIAARLIMALGAMLAVAFFTLGQMAPAKADERATLWLDQVAAACPPGTDIDMSVIESLSDERLAMVVEQCKLLADSGLFSEESPPVGEIIQIPADDPIYAAAADEGLPPEYAGATKGFAEVFGIPKGYRNAGIRTPQKAVCKGRLTLDLSRCGVDSDGRKYCLNKCVY
jgi:hypothetical protein